MKNKEYASMIAHRDAHDDAKDWEWLYSGNQSLKESMFAKLLHGSTGKNNRPRIAPDAIPYTSVFVDYWRGFETGFDNAAYDEDDYRHIMKYLAGLEVKPLKEIEENKKSSKPWLAAFDSEQYKEAERKAKERKAKKAMESLESAEAWRQKILAEIDLEGAEDGFVPTNEFETIMLFSKIDRLLGFTPVRMKVNRFPDGIYENESGDRLFVEFEYRSSNFIKHKHDPKKTDIVICWIHDAELIVPVIELEPAYNPKNLSFDLSKINIS